MNMIVQEPQTVQVGEPYHTTQFAGSKRRLVQPYNVNNWILNFIHSARLSTSYVTSTMVFSLHAHHLVTMLQLTTLC